MHSVRWNDLRVRCQMLVETLSKRRQFLRNLFPCLHLRQLSFLGTKAKWRVKLIQLLLTTMQPSIKVAQTYLSKSWVKWTSPSYTSSKCSKGGCTSSTKNLMKRFGRRINHRILETPRSLRTTTLPFSRLREIMWDWVRRAQKKCASPSKTSKRYSAA